MAERAHPPFLNYQPEISGAGGDGPRPADRGREGGSFRTALPDGLGCGRHGSARRGAVQRGGAAQPSPRRAALPARASCPPALPALPKPAPRSRRETSSPWQSSSCSVPGGPLSSVPARLARAGAAPAGLLPSADPQGFRRLTLQFRRPFSLSHSPKVKDCSAIRA